MGNFWEEVSFTQIIAPRGSSDGAASAICKKVSSYIGLRYVVNFEIKRGNYVKLNWGTRFVRC
jgi:hypothetical protein